jgi:hypothetical protein
LKNLGLAVLKAVQQQLFRHRAPIMDEFAILVGAWRVLAPKTQLISKMDNTDAGGPGRRLEVTTVVRYERRR